MSGKKLERELMEARQKLALGGSVRWAMKPWTSAGEINLGKVVTGRIAEGLKGPG